MYVACSTLCFGRHPLETAFRKIADLEFAKVDVAIRTSGPHLTPAEAADDPGKAVQRLRIGPGLTPAAIKLEIADDDADEFERQFRACCQVARQLAVAIITIPTSAVGVPLEYEIERLTRLLAIASAEGLVLSVETRIGTLTETPDAAVALCRRVDGLGIALDPSHYLCGPHQNKPYDQVYPYVRHVRLRDSGRTPDRMQVSVGQGEVEYGRIINQLQRHGYDRLLAIEIMDGPDLPFNVETEVRKLKYLLESLI